MRISKRCLSNILFCSLFLLVSCGKDKNMDDKRRDDLQQNLMRINSIQGAYSGPVISKIDNSNLGNLTLNFKSTTNTQSNSICMTNGQAVVSGSISLKSLTTTEVTFDNGCYDDISGDFEVTIPVDQGAGLKAKISLSGKISAGNWNGSLEVNGQPQNGAFLNLVKNAVPGNISEIEVAGARLEQMRRLTYSYLGSYEFNGSTAPFELSFTNNDIFPEQSLYNLLSPTRQVVLNCVLAGYNLTFSSALLNDNTGVLIAHDPIDQQGRPTKVNLVCNKFDMNNDYGWDCEIKIKAALLKTHLSVKR
jgi:hypothetical protein